MTPFDTPGPKLIAALIRDHPLALIVSDGPDGFHATPLPLLAKLDDDGVVMSFEGHFARRNPQVEAFRDHQRALIIFRGPESYIPAETVADPDWIPTWNYTIARFEVDVFLNVQDNRGSVDRLVERLEPGAWRPASHVPRRHAAMLGHVVAFEAKVHRASATFKLGQDERDDNFHQIVDWLGNDPLAGWMRRMKIDHE